MPCSEPKASLKPGFTGAKQPVEGLSYVYMLMCHNGSFYVGMADDIQKRIHLHRNGSGARHTKLLKVFELVYYEGPMSRNDAAKRELQLKKWSRAKKAALIRHDFQILSVLSKSRD